MNFHSEQIKIGVSACLHGENVRYEGGHKYDPYIVETLGEYLKLIPFCPEMEAGMGVPREPVYLSGDNKAPRMLGLKSEKDWTGKLNSAGDKHIRRLRKLKISGYILKSASPSCGIRKVKLYPTGSSRSNRNGQGLLAGKLIDTFPLLPVTDEMRLADANFRENFVVRVFAYDRLNNFLGRNFNQGLVNEFHTAHKYLLMAHSSEYYRKLGQIMGNIKNYTLDDFKAIYSGLFMRALSYKSTVKKNAKVLMHIFGYLKNIISKNNIDSIQKSINSYRLEKVSLTVPITAINNQILSHKIEYLRNQFYLNPHPHELMLRDQNQ